jgi:hypothetical protein
MMAFAWGFLGMVAVMLTIYGVSCGLSAWRQARHKREWPATRLREMNAVAPGDRREQDLPFVGADRRSVQDIVKTALGEGARPAARVALSDVDEPMRRQA